MIARGKGASLGKEGSETIIKVSIVMIVMNKSIVMNEVFVRNISIVMFVVIWNKGREGECWGCEVPAAHPIIIVLQQNGK